MNVVWNVNNTCNLKCIHCGEALDMNSASLLETSKLETVLFNLSSIAESVTLLGGEPLLHKRIEYILSFLSERNVRINLITNGQFDASFADTICKYNLSNIVVSVDGLPNENDYIRGSGAWNTSMKFLERLLVNRQTKKGMEVAVNTVINKANRGNIVSWIRSLMEYKLSNIQLTPLYLSGRALENCEKLQLTSKEFLEVCEEIAGCVSDFEIKNINLDCGNAALISYLNMKYNLDLSNRKYECDALLSSAFCDYAGMLHPCREVNDPATDLTQMIDWDKEFKKFDTFFSRICVEDSTCSVGCFALQSCGVCPLHQRISCELCEEVFKRIDEFFSENILLKVNEPCCFFEYLESYYVFWGSADAAKVEYTLEGFRILKHIENEWCTTQEISSSLGMENRVVNHFLVQEYLKGRVSIRHEV